MSKLNVKNRSIFCRDNLDVIRGINSECIDLIYIDPPFNKKKVFTAPIGSSSEGASFKDYFREEDLESEWLETIQEEHEALYSFLSSLKVFANFYNYAYLCYMAIRILELHRILKKTGSFYLHCDATMSHYLKLLIDCIFGEANFRNEIVWDYSRSKGYVSSKYQFPRKHDTILFYSKSSRNIHFFREERYKETRSIDELKGLYAGDYFYCDNEGYIHWDTIKTKKEKYVARWKKVFFNRFKRDPRDGDKLHIIKDPLLKSVWWDIHFLNPSEKSKERIGYPTQKPLALLERIIKASSKEGDIVLDAFCGCATTCIASERLGRQWIGIDISIKSYELLKVRLKKEVRNSENLFDDNKNLHFSAVSPKRTDRGSKSQNKK